MNMNCLFSSLYPFNMPDFPSMKMMLSLWQVGYESNRPVILRRCEESKLKESTNCGDVHRSRSW